MFVWWGRELIKFYGGRIEVESRPAQGTTFAGRRTHIRSILRLGVDVQPYIGIGSDLT